MAKLLTKTFDICSMDKAGAVYTIDATSSPGWEQPTPALGVAISKHTMTLQVCHNKKKHYSSMQLQYKK